MLLGLFAFTWFGVLMGMLIRSSDAMQGIGFAIMLPLSFLAGTFVPISGHEAGPPGHRRMGSALGAGGRRPPGLPGNASRAAPSSSTTRCRP